jgi:uncharacterized protein YndB with AHSA1/START domain
LRTVQDRFDECRGGCVPDILQDFPIKASVERVFDAISTPAGLNSWWTDTASGTPRAGSEFALRFGPGYDWRANVTRCIAPTDFELHLVQADEDWLGTRVGFHLEAASAKTLVRFRHTGWRSVNEHYRISCHCWAMYLRVLRRYLEHGERVAYSARLEV